MRRVGQDKETPVCALYPIAWTIAPPNGLAATREFIQKDEPALISLAPEGDRVTFCLDSIPP
jgi:hypothetical protein